MQHASPQSGSPDQDRFAAVLDGVKQVLRTGLPLVPRTTPEALLRLDGVTARSVRPDDPVARLDALEKLLRRELRRLGLPKLRPAAAPLFGIGHGGASLTERRRAAASEAGFSLDHLRKHLEPRLCEQLATQLYTDSLQYVQRSYDGQPFEASGDTPTISEDDIADVRDAAREAAISQIWSDVYGLRAELLRLESLRESPERVDDREDAGTGARWHLARLLTQIRDFTERYGPELASGAAPFTVDGLVRLAGWKGEFSPVVAADLRLRLATAGPWDRAAFARVDQSLSDRASP